MATSLMTSTLRQVIGGTCTRSIVAESGGRLTRRVSAGNNIAALFSSESGGNRKKTLAALTEEMDLHDKTVFVRVDLNVPMDKETGSISDDTRARAVVPTVSALRDHGAKVVLCSHYGRPKGQVVDDMRLAPVAERLCSLLDCTVKQCDDSIGEGVKAGM